jgi:catalase
MSYHCHQARLFTYGDTQRHRIGPNYEQLPVNCPIGALHKGTDVHRRAGPMSPGIDHDGAPNYYPNSFYGPMESDEPRHQESSFKISSTDVGR